MLVESIVIIFVVLSVGVAYIRAKKREYAIAIIPITILPLGNVAAVLTAGTIAKFLAVEQQAVAMTTIVIALSISCIATALMSHNISSKSARRAYMIVCGSFLVILALIYIIPLI